MKTISEALKERSRGSVYREAAKIFSVHYSLVAKIASGERKAIRGKSKDIKIWLEKQVG